MLTAIFSLLLLPVSLWTAGAERTLLWGLGAGAFLVLLMPVVLRHDFDLFEPISFVMLTTLLGVTLRSIYVGVFRNENIDVLLLLGKPAAELLTGGIAILLGLCALVAGYWIKTPTLKIRHLSLLQKDNWRKGRFILVIVLFSTIALIGTIVFIRKAGITFVVLSNISSKHTYFIEEAQYKYSALGYYRWAASLFIPAFYLMLAWFAKSGKRWVSPVGFVVILLGLLSAIFPFLNSSRSDVAYVLILGMVIWHYLRRRISMRSLAWALGAILVVISVMTAFRKQADDIRHITTYMTGEKVLETLVGNRNFFGVDKTAHIMENIPGKLPFAYGQTLITWVFAPIPRTLWPQKPIVSMGSVIGQEVYGTKDSEGKGAGISPGFIAELYWNFGYVGVIAGMFIMGVCLKFLYATFKPYLTSNRNAVLVYTPVMFAFSFVLMGVTFSQAVIDSLTQLIPLVLAIFFVGRVRPSKRTI
jgi:oligosaccharide repeat unit polymerase